MTIEYLLPSLITAETISLEQAIHRRVRRRRRVAKRMVKRFPLFAVEFMQPEFPEYDYETFVADVTRKKDPAGPKEEGEESAEAAGTVSTVSKSPESICLDQGSRIPLRGAGGFAVCAC